MFNSIRLLFLVLIIVGFQLTSRAQEESSKIKKLSKDSDVILTGKVIEKKSSWNESKTRIYTKTTVQVEDYLKGTNSEGSIEIRSLGGEVGDVGELYSHMPRFEDEEEVLVFLKKDDKNKEYKVLNGEEGKITVIADKKSKEKVTGSGVKIDKIKIQIKKYLEEH
jgi:hypothetical protein